MVPKTGLAVALEVYAWLELDQNIPTHTRCSRDRKIGLNIPLTTTSSQFRQVMHWWRQVDKGGIQSNAARWWGIRFWLIAGLFFVGVISGSTLCSVALSYDGGQPINVLAMLGVFVGFPALLLLLTCVSCTAQALGFRATASLFNTFNINRWVLGYWDKLTGIDLGDQYNANGESGRLAFWQVVVFSQWFALGFFTGALLVFFALLVFTDLAFGWSTTLNVQAENVYAWVSFAAAPWSFIMPNAVPDIALVESSQFYRIDQVGAVSNASRLGEWWPFVLMSLLIWGVLPRLMLFAVASWRSRVSAEAYLLSEPNVIALLERMSSPLVEPGDSKPRQSPVWKQENIPSASQDRFDFIGDKPVVIIWNDAIENMTLQGQVGAPLHLSSLLSEVEKAKVLAEMREGYDSLVLITKGWEPPLLEFLDLLILVRSSVGAEVHINVMPLGLSQAKLSDVEQTVWCGVLNQVVDDKISVVTS